MKVCPFCAEEILDAAIKCKHCGSMLRNSPSAIDDVSSVATNKARISLNRNWLQFFVCVVIAMALSWSSYYILSIVESNWGWVLAFFALGALYGAIHRDFICSYCKHAEDVKIISFNKECEKCKVLHVIDWK